MVRSKSRVVKVKSRVVKLKSRVIKLKLRVVIEFEGDEISVRMTFLHNLEQRKTECVYFCTAFYSIVLFHCFPTYWMQDLTNSFTASARATEKTF